MIRVLQFGCRLVVLRRLAYHKGEDGSSIRWFAEYDSSVQALRHRHSRMLLADLVIIMQGASPFNAAVDFADDLSEVFRKSGQSMQAACHVLRDESLFQATSGIQSATPNRGIPAPHQAHSPLNLPPQLQTRPPTPPTPPSPSPHPAHPQRLALSHAPPLLQTTSAGFQFHAFPRSFGSAKIFLPATGWTMASAFSRTGAARARSQSASRPGSAGRLLSGCKC
jgi:hypothetical protein